mgnify:CR=1 FL=1
MCYISCDSNQVKGMIRMQNQSIGKYISSIYRYQSILINKQFQPFGIGCGQYIFLIHIAQNPGINQKDLSERVMIDRANTHRAIKKLSSLGYIHTHRDENDKRIIKSYLTEEGKGFLPEIKRGLANITDSMLENFDDAQRTMIFSLLEKIEQNVQDHVRSQREEQTWRQTKDSI